MQLYALVGLNCSNWIAMQGMENVKLCSFFFSAPNLVVILSCWIF